MNTLRIIRINFISVLIIYVVFVSVAHPQKIQFERLSTTNGLSNNLVYDILQDKTGFLWIATDDGLNRFDGYEFKIFRNEPNNINSLSDNSVWSLAEDNNGRIWIGTKSGWLNCFDPVNEKFSRWHIGSKIIKENTITVIFPEDDNKIWIGTYRSGLYLLNPETSQLSNWQFNPFDSNSITYNYISSIKKDYQNNLWLGTYNGLTKLSRINSKYIFKQYYKDEKNQNSLSDNLIWNISNDETDQNILWIGTANNLTSYNIAENKFTRYLITNPDKLQFGTGCGNVIVEYYNDQKLLWIDSYAGLIRFNLTTSKVDRFTTEKNNPFSLPSNRINKIYRDRSGVLWIGTDNGLAYFSQKKIKFNYSISPNINYLNSPELYDISITSLSISKDGTLWIGTEKGLYYSEKNNLRIQKLFALSDANIWSLSSDDKNNLWIGTYGKGFYQLNCSTKKITDWTYLNKRTKSLSRFFIKSIFTDNTGNIWIGYWGLGLAKFIQQSNEFKVFVHNNHDSTSLSFDDVWVIYQDRKNRIWVGTNGGGLNLLSDEKGFKHFLSEPNAKFKLGSNSIYSICESVVGVDKNKTILWIGTNNGLSKIIINENSDLDFSSNIESKIYTIADGLPDNSIKSLIEDNNGNIWIGTSSGISRFNPLTERFVNFNTADGLISNDINLSAAAILNDETVLMGSKAGLMFFNPNQIKQSDYKPQIVLTDFRIFNQSLKVTEDSPLKQSIVYSDEIEIPYSENVFSIQFSAIDFNSSKSIQYAFMLEGFDKEWRTSTDVRTVTYTNLNPGSYVFRLKATNSDGVWSDNIRSLKIIILPPWWQTYWAVALYVLVFVLGVWGIVKFQVNREKLQQELKRQEFEAHHLREVEKMKSRFFANLSHEFRTPLLLIKGPLEQLINGKAESNLLEYYQMIKRNADRLQNLIDQLLELSQLESEALPLNIQKQNIISVIRNAVANFSPLAKQKKINLNFSCEYENILTAFDKDKLEKIINNLISNAIKFTNEQGEVNVEIEPEKNENIYQLKIKISDTGIGISEEHLPKIFERFYQVDDTTYKSEGFGIGLALVKELVTIHRWNISVDSKKSEGTTFTITIPLSEEEYNQIFINNDEEVEELNEILFIEADDKEIIQGNGNNNPKLLFVEDSEDVRIYVSHLLKPHYNLLLSDNAREGIELAKTHSPDLIVSDVMMPEMDGFEFCKIIKTDLRTSHIPVILLTARATRDSKLEGLETGADDYITKPFDSEELLIRIKNLIEQRKLLREKFSKEIYFNPESLALNSLDKNFMKKITEVVEKNLYDFTFDSEKLAMEISISRSNLNRKLRAITGKGPGEFIRDLRMKKAAQYIIEDKFSITQIALEIGFASPAQFTRAFKKHFGCLPSEFKEKCTGNDC